MTDIDIQIKNFLCSDKQIELRAKTPFAKPVVRFAPSMNGDLHLGHALNFYANYFYARKHGGQLLLVPEMPAPSVYENPGFRSLLWPDCQWAVRKKEGLDRRMKWLSLMIEFYYRDVRWICPDFAYPFLPLCLHTDMYPFFNNILSAIMDTAHAEYFYADQEFFKHAVSHKLGVDTLIRGRDLQGFPLVRRFTDCFQPSPKEYYHPLLVCDDGKVSKSSAGLHPELQLTNLIGNNPEMEGMARSQRSMVLGAYAVAAFSGMVPTTLEEVFIFYLQYDIDHLCAQPNIVYSGRDFSACVQLVRKHLKEQS